MAEVSVLLPVRDAAATLPEALGSLLAQTLADFEILAVDDGSRDQSRALLESCAQKDARLRVLDGHGRGLVAALNLALAEARAPWLARMDADDVAHPERLQRQRACLRSSPGLDVVATRVAILGSSGAGMRRYVTWSNELIEHEQILRDLLVEAPLVHPSVMLRAELLQRLGGYRDFDGPEDYDLWLRAARAGARFAKLPEVLLAWRDGPTRLTRSSGRYAPERFLALKLEALEQGWLDAGRAVVLWGGGPVAKGWCRALLRRGHDVRAFVDVAPRRLGGSMQGRPVVSVEQAPGFPGALHLAAVGQPGARERIRGEALRLGLVEGRDLVAVA